MQKFENREREGENKEREGKIERKRGNRKHDKLSIEMILRRSFCDSLKDYMHNCSLAGVRQMCNPEIGIFKRLFWILIFCASFSAVLYYLKYTWSDTLTKPFIVTMESSEYPIGSIDFPAVAICSINRISKSALAKFAEEEYLEISDKESIEDVKNTLLNLGRLIDYSYNESLRHNPLFLRLMERYRIDSQKIVGIMKSLAPSCDDILLRCAWAGSLVDCKDIFTMRRTANRGHCCTFNYVLNVYNLGRLGNTEEVKKKQDVPGFLTGLNVILDPMIHDYAYPLRGMQGFDVLIFNSMQFADPSAGRVVHRIAEPNTALFLELETIKQVASKEVRKYNIQTRKCLFHNELKKEFSNMYSYSTCIIFCRIYSIQSLCKCIPYFYALNKQFQGVPICTLDNLKCLNKYKDKFSYLFPFDTKDKRGLEMEVEDSLSCAECRPDCEMTQHKTKGYKAPLILENYDKVLIDLLFESLNVSDKSYVSVYYPTHDATLVRLDVVFYWFEVLSNVGGFGGICIGFSITSIMEIIYFFTIRFIRHFRVNYKKYY